MNDNIQGLIPKDHEIKQNISADKFHMPNLSRLSDIKIPVNR